MSVHILCAGADNQCSQLCVNIKLFNIPDTCLPDSMLIWIYVLEPEPTLYPGSNIEAKCFLEKISVRAHKNNVLGRSCSKSFLSWYFHSYY